MAAKAAIGAALAAAAKNFVISLVVNAVIGAVFGGGKKRRGQEIPRSVLVNKQSNNDPIPVVYGSKRMGGVRVYVDTSDGSGGSGTDTLNIALVVSEGEMGTLKKLVFNDTLVWDADASGTTTGSATTGYTLANFESTKYSSYISAQWFPGHDDQDVSTLLKDSIGPSTWTENHKLRGLHYIALKLPFNATAYEGGVPLVTVVADGKKIVDVGATTNFASPTYTTSADQNPVDVIYDYLTNSRYGLGVGYADIDTDTFKTVRTYVEAMPANDKYKINGHLDTDKKLFENINELAQAFNAFLVYTGGKYSLKLRRDDETGIFTFDTSNIIGDLEINLADINNRINKIQATYANKDLDTGNGYSGYNDDILVVENSTYLTADRDRVLEQRIESNLITDETLLTNILNHKLDASRKNITVGFEAAHTGIQVEAGDVIAITHPQAGFESKLFRVLSITLTGDNTLNMVAQEYDGDIEL